MAATKMLTQLLRGDSIAYVVRPVSNFDEIKQTLNENITSDTKSVFMLNCGAV
jgi:NifU-like protein involved in Fe-S cluster formation